MSAETFPLEKFLSSAIGVSQTQAEAKQGEYFYTLPHVGVAATPMTLTTNNNRLRSLAGEFSSGNSTGTIYPHWLPGEAFMEAAIVLEANHDGQRHEPSVLEVEYHPFHASLKRGMFHRGFSDSEFGDMANYHQYLNLNMSFGVFSGEEQQAYLDSDLYTLLTQLTGEDDQRHLPTDEQRAKGIRNYDVRKKPLVWMNVSDLTGAVVEKHAAKIAVFREIAPLHSSDDRWHKLYYRFLRGRNIRPDQPTFEAAMRQLQRTKTPLSIHSGLQLRTEIPRQAVIKIMNVDESSGHILDQVEELLKREDPKKAFAELKRFEEKHFKRTLPQQERRKRAREIKIAEDQSSFEYIEIRHAMLHLQIDAEETRQRTARKKNLGTLL